jgi:hypothetical protein
MSSPTFSRAQRGFVNPSRPRGRWLEAICPVLAAWALLTPSAIVPIVRAAGPTSVEELRINQLQFIGTHNSYHVRAKPSRNFPSLNYSHAPLDAQFDRGVRSVELDLHDRDGVFEVFHVVGIDEGTTCRRLSDALETIRKWSDGHPRHLPISVLFELKKDGVGLDPRIRRFDAASLDRLDDLLRSVFPAARRITPDDIRGTAATLREAVEKGGWPTLAASRGKVFFILHDEGKLRDFYTQKHPSLRGRAMFVRSDDSRDDAAVLVLDDPRDPEIPRLVSAGYFIRTRADSDLHIDRAGKTSGREAALASGAQIVSTDFPPGEPQVGNGYLVEFAKSAPARVNPINGPEALRGQTLAQ